MLKLLWIILVGRGGQIFILSVILSSCYSHQKAATQFGKAAITYPEIPAEYCARTYPPKDSLIKGDTVLHIDTVIIAGDQFFDTVTVNDTVRITRTIPNVKTITQRITIHDTMRVVNTADLKLCEIERRAAVLSEQEIRKDRDSWKKKAKQQFGWIVGIGGAILLGLILLLARAAKKQIPRN